MASREFSETQFVFAYLRELFSSYRFPNRFMPWGNFMFPTQPAERRIPVDFLIDFYTHSEFYQFKVSEYLERRRGNRERHAGVPAAFLPYYRFKIYNRTNAVGLGQFEMLRNLATQFPNDSVYYCAPCFHTEWDFHNYFNSETIIRNSALINCRQFNNPNFLPTNFDINDGEAHYMVFKNGNPNGYLCSEAKEIKVSFSNDNDRYKEVIEKRGDLVETIKYLYYEVYLRDTLKFNEKREMSDKVNMQFYIVSKYLFQYYNTIWMPKYKYNHKKG